MARLRGLLENPTFRACKAIVTVKIKQNILGISAFIKDVP